MKCCPGVCLAAGPPAAPKRSNVTNASEIKSISLKICFLLTWRVGRCSLSPPDDWVAHFLAHNWEKFLDFFSRFSRSSKIDKALSNCGRQLDTDTTLYLIEKYKIGNSGQREGPGRTRRSRADSERSETGSSIGWHGANSDTEMRANKRTSELACTRLTQFALFNLPRERHNFETYPVWCHKHFLGHNSYAASDSVLCNIQ